MLVLSPEDQKLVDRGLRAKRLLNDPMFQEVVNELFEQFKDALFSTAPENTKDRELLYFRHSGLQDAVLTLGSWDAQSRMLLDVLSEKEISE